MLLTTPAASAWQAEQPRLFGIAYRMLGTVTDAEDVVAEVGAAAIVAEQADSAIVSWPAWLTTTCVRRSIDALRAAKARREAYVGPWLPEPVATDRLPDEIVATRELLSIALLHLAERLSPRERAALVLNRAFVMAAPEIAEVLHTTPANARQLVSRAQRKLHLDENVAPSSHMDAHAMDRLITAISAGDVPTVLAMLDDDAVLFSDGGGKVSAARRPIRGADAIARFLIGVFDKARRANEEITARPTSVNGEFAFDVHRGSRRDIVTIAISPSGRLGAIYQVSNPDKQTHVPAS